MGRSRSWTDEQFIEAVRISFSWREVAKVLGKQAKGNTHYSLMLSAKRLSVDVSHMKGQGWNHGLKMVNHTRNWGRRAPLSSILVKDSTYKNLNSLKRRLISEGIKEHRCEECRRTMWENHPIPIELDHVNGDKKDNRIENLRFICPNCHTLTPTYKGKNTKKYKDKMKMVDSIGVRRGFIHPDKR